MAPDRAAEFRARTHLTTIKLAASLLEHDVHATADRRRRAHDVSAVDRLCATLEASTEELRRSISGRACAEAAAAAADQASRRAHEIRSELNQLRQELSLDRS